MGRGEREKNTYTGPRREKGKGEKLNPYRFSLEGLGKKINTPTGSSGEERREKSNTIQVLAGSRGEK